MKKSRLFTFNKSNVVNNLYQVFFLGPALFFFMLIVCIPFLLGIYYSFTSWNGVSDTMRWVGLHNYIQLFTDKNFIRSFGFTFKFTVVSVVLTNIMGLFLAVLLSGQIKTRNALRTVFFMPNVISGLLLGFIWQFIFIKGFAAIGEITKIGLFELPWLGTPATGFWAMIIVKVWRGAGYLMIIYIAGLSNVPTSMIEAARIDGASKLQVLRSVILPLLMPAITVCLFISISGAFKMFDLNLALTNGGPFDTTRTVALDIYMEAFTNDRMGLGASKAVVFFIVVALISIIQVIVTKRKEVEA